MSNPSDEDAKLLTPYVYKWSLVSSKSKQSRVCFPGCLGQLDTHHCVATIVCTPKHTARTGSLFSWLPWPAWHSPLRCNNCVYTKTHCTHWQSVFLVALASLTLTTALQQLCVHQNTLHALAVCFPGCLGQLDTHHCVATIVCTPKHTARTGRTGVRINQ